MTPNFNFTTITKAASAMPPAQSPQTSVAQQKVIGQCQMDSVIQASSVVSPSVVKPNLQSSTSVVVNGSSALQQASTPKEKVDLLGIGLLFTLQNRSISLHFVRNGRVFKYMPRFAKPRKKFTNKFHIKILKKLKL